MSGQSALQRTTPRVTNPTAFQINAQTLRASRARPIRTQETVLSTFGSGHGWTGSSTFTDSDSGGWANTCVLATSNGSGGGVTLTSPALTTFNPAGKTFVIKANVTDWSKVFALELWLSQDAAFTNATHYTIVVSTALPPVANGEWGILTIPAVAKSTTGTGVGTTATYARLYASDNSGGAVNVRWGGVSYYTPTPFPNGAVTFTFDDSFASHWSIVRPAFNTYRYRATLFPILDLIGQSGKLTLDNLQQFNSEGWEIGSHASTNAIHNVGMLGLPNDAARESELQTCKAWLVANGFKSESFAYPLSASDSPTQAIVQRYYQFARSANQGGTFETLPAAKLSSIRSYQVGSTTSLSTMQTAIQNAYTYGYHQIFMIHDVLASGASGQYQILTATLQSLLSTCASTGIPVLPLSDVYSKLV